MNIDLAIISLTNLDEHISREPKHFTEVKNSIAKLTTALDAACEMKLTRTDTDHPLLDDMDWSQDHAECEAASDFIREIVHQLRPLQRAVLYSCLDLDVEAIDENPVLQALGELSADIVRCAAPWYQSGHNLSFYYRS